MAVVTDVQNPTGSPLWLKVANDLAAELATGSLKAGSRLESEAALCGRFGASRVTVRQALSELRTRGLVHPLAGRGWFVGEEPSVARLGPLQEPPGMMVSFTEMARSRGLTPDSVVISSSVRQADLDEANRLGVAPGAPLLSLRRIRRLDGLPVAVDHSRVPAALIPNYDSVDFAHGSLFEELRRNGVNPARADYEVQAEAAAADEARWLEVDPGFPLLSARELMLDDLGRRIELGHIRYRGDRYRFRALLRA